MHGQRDSVFEGNFGWVELSNAEAAASLAGGSAIEGFLTIDTANAEPIFGELPEKVKLHVHVVGPATEAVQLGASLLIRYSLENPIWITEEVFALFDFDDQAILLSVCSQDFTAKLREVAVASGASSVTGFVRNAADPASPENALMAEEFAIPTVTTVPETSWYDLDPDQRSLDPGDAPPEVIEQLDWAYLLILSPNAWSGVDANLCPRVELGWAGICAPTKGGLDLAILNLAIQDGMPAELWLTTPPTEVQERLTLLTTIDQETLAKIPEGGGILVTLSGDPSSLAGVDDLVQSGGVQTTVVNYTEIDELIKLYVPEGEPATGP